MFYKLFKAGDDVKSVSIYVGVGRKDVFRIINQIQ